MHSFILNRKLILFLRFSIKKAALDSATQCFENWPLVPKRIRLPERVTENIKYFISPSGNRTHNRHAYSHTPKRHDGLSFYYYKRNRKIIFTVKKPSACSSAIHCGVLLSFLRVVIKILQNSEKKIFYCFIIF